MKSNALCVFLIWSIVRLQCIRAVEIDRYCPRLMHQVFEGFAPAGNNTAGRYDEYEAPDLQSCVMACCRQNDKCNVAFMFNQTCYHVKCINDEMCLPLKRPTTVSSDLQMVLVNPIAKEISWPEIIKLHKLESALKPQLEATADGNEFGLSDNVYREPVNPFAKYPNRIFDDPLSAFGNRFVPSDQYAQYDNDLMADESKISMNREAIRCDLERDGDCPDNEYCVAIPQREIAICKCKIGFMRNQHMKCVLDIDDADSKTAENLSEKLMRMKEFNNVRLSNDPKIDNAESEAQKERKLTVKVMSKEVQLPDKNAALIAYVVPDESMSGVTYNYSWSLISQPPGDVNGTMSDKTKQKIELQNLSEGVYQFKVIVSGRGWHGQTLANVTVLPERRIKKAPIVIITPEQQTIKEPTSMAILDGSTSKDDDHIKQWHWDLIEGPMNYQPLLAETSTLQLANLTFPGNYTFRLTVTDSDNISNSTTARITVLKATDYPPTANAGQVVRLELPENSVTLNGTLSSDDHGIVAWEWTKDASDTSKAVDMQDTRKPYLKLSNLEEGVYTFVLKVTDASNQSDTASVRVFVHRSADRPPTANAGRNETINLPQNWFTLNATNSSDDGKITSFEWTQIGGPTTPTIGDRKAAVTNVTGLSLGTYSFQLNVVDQGSKNDSAVVQVTVVQEKNTAPVARAGGDQTITLPTNSIYMNGSGSSDDLEIVKFEWKRDDSSLAIGTIVGNTDHERVLILTNIVSGRYVFALTVTDTQGLSSSDTVSIIVHPDPLLMNLVEVTFAVGVTALTQAEILSLQQKLVLLLGNNLKLVVRDLRTEPKTGDAILVFYVEEITGSNENKVLLGLDVERMLSDKMWRGSNIVGAPIADIRTSVCQNKCSGHGVCNSETRACMCETFWMPSVYYFWGISEANCDWSILYVVIGTFILFIVISSICWALTCYCRRQVKPRTRSKAQKYSLLESQEAEAPSLNRGTSLSESETDSDVLFESQSNSNGKQRLKNGSAKNGQKLYATTRLGRRIKA